MMRLGSNYDQRRQGAGGSVTRRRRSPKSVMKGKRKGFPEDFFNACQIEQKNQ